MTADLPVPDMPVMSTRFTQQLLPPGSRLYLREVATRADGGCGEGLGWRVKWCSREDEHRRAAVVITDSS
jgi:hypothetical protein